MKKNSIDNSYKEHWDKMGGNYSGVWNSRLKSQLSSKELNYVGGIIKTVQPENYLDVGFGTGRIIKNAIEFGASSIYGTDISNSMLDICLKLFKDNKKIKDLKIFDFTESENPFPIQFDFITSIRVMKYSKNWKMFLKNIYNSLRPGGIFVVTYLNKNSITNFSPQKVPMVRISSREIRKEIEHLGGEIVDVIGFTRLPDFFYDFSDNNLYVRFINFFELFLNRVLGKTFLCRMLFVVIKRKE